MKTLKAIIITLSILCFSLTLIGGFIYLLILIPIIILIVVWIILILGIGYKIYKDIYNYLE